VSQALIEALQNPALYPHPVSGFTLIETHISWVLLTGEYAYKIKKPVNFGFLDFSTREAREHFCHEELRLNQRTAPELYLEVLSLTGSVEAPQIGGDGPVFEHMIRMRQFDQAGLLDSVQARGELSAAHIDELAASIAALHRSAAVVPEAHALGTAEAIMAPVRQNFEQIRPLLDEAADLARLDYLEGWAEDSFARLREGFDQRKADGFIRECHGDIHLANATLIDGRVVLFDCIEFNEPFRLIDVISDLAFLAMDLEHRGLDALSARLVNAYIEDSGDHAGLQLLAFYKAYRAMVRAKISLFCRAGSEDAAVRQQFLDSYRSYAALAERCSAIPSRFLAITHGVSGVGKSWVSMRLIEAFGAIRLRSDVERKRLFPQADTTTLYSAASSAATYARLHQLAGQVLQAGFPVVLDATYLREEQRAAALAVAEAAGVPELILDCQAPQALIEQWLLERAAEGQDPSDADVGVMLAQQAGREALSSEEQAHAVVVDTSHPQAMDVLIERIRQRCPQ
jgi:aminoglycoside phosphotransferase family enzyme/predicted kinase